jgi:hypothetical protein
MKRLITGLLGLLIERLSFESSKVEVLQTLIANPAFSPAAKEAILMQVGKLSFDSNKTALLVAIQKRAEGK